MILDQTGNTTILTQETLSIIELVKKIDSIYSKLKNYNIIVNLNSLNSISKNDIVEFLNVSNTHRASNYSFVIVASKIDLDQVPDEIIVVPTLQEANDIIEMEEMERDLGF